MPKYRANADIWLSHECRPVKEGEEFDTTFPLLPDGKPMRLGDNITLVPEGRTRREKDPTPDPLV